MKRFSLLRTIPLSFFSIETYRDVARNWHGLGFVYTLLLLILCATVVQSLLVYKLSKIDVQAFIVDFYQQEAQSGNAVPLEDVVNSALDMVAQLPPVTFQDGVATSIVEQPYIVTEPLTGKPVLVVDTTGQLRSLHDQEALILLTDRATVVKKNHNREQVDYFASMDQGEQYALTIASHAVADIPPMTLKNGVLKTEEDRVYLINNLYNNEVLAVIDTTGSIISLDQTDAPILLTQTHLYAYYTDEQGQEKTFVFELVDINEENLLLLAKEWIPTAKKWIIALILLGIPFIALVQFIIAMLIFLCLGGIGLLVAKIIQAKGLEYEVTVRLAAVSATPAIIALTIFDVPLLFSVVLAMSYLLFSVAINRHTIGSSNHSSQNME